MLTFRWHLDVNILLRHKNFILAELLADDLTNFMKKNVFLCVFFQNTVGTYFLNSRTDIAPTYEGRAFLDVNMEKRVSTLRLMNVKMVDSRRFQCSVIIPNDDEGTTRASTSLLVLGENELLFDTF